MLRRALPGLGGSFLLGINVGTLMLGVGFMMGGDSVQTNGKRVGLMIMFSLQSWDNSAVSHINHT